jgi:hypothetical protein
MFAPPKLNLAEIFRSIYLAPLLSLACSAVLGCGPGGTTTLTLLASGQDEAFFSVQGSINDLWVVGADRGDGPRVLQLTGVDGEDLTWQQHGTGHSGDIWWVQPFTDEVILVGASGLILEYDRSNDSFSKVEGTDEGITFFGTWGADPSDIWVVGGSLSDDNNGSVWRRQNGQWAEYRETVLEDASPGTLYFKVDGNAADDLWIVGSRGIAMHWNGTSLSHTETGVGNASLFTVEARPEGAVAVGGLGLASVVHREGDVWTDYSPALQPQVNGVCAAGESMRAVGAQGSSHIFSDGAWESSLELLTLQDYHACWTDTEGNFMAVGGHISNNPFNEGVLAFLGPASIPAPPGAE